MGLYKEAEHFLEELSKRQIRIYRDAADYGIPVPEVDSPTCVEIAQAFDNELLFGGLKKHRNEYRSSRAISVHVAIYLPWEQTKNYVSCTRWDIMYYNDLIRKMKFISLTPKNVQVKPQQIWERP